MLHNTSNGTQVLVYIISNDTRVIADIASNDTQLADTSNPLQKAFSKIYKAMVFGKVFVARFLCFPNTEAVR